MPPTPLPPHPTPCPPLHHIPLPSPPFPQPKPAVTQHPAPLRATQPLPCPHPPITHRPTAPAQPRVPTAAEPRAAPRSTTALGRDSITPSRSAAAPAVTPCPFPQRDPSHLVPPHPAQPDCSRAPGNQHHFTKKLCTEQAAACSQKAKKPPQQLGSGIHTLVPPSPVENRTDNQHQTWS